LKNSGVAIVYISHRLSEVFALGDRITVLRDGRKIASLLPAETTPDQLVTLMVGRPVDTTYTRPGRPTPGEIALEVSNLSGPGFSDINLTVRAGEIVGLSGLVGSGRTEVARAIFGADRVTAGRRFRRFRGLSCFRRLRALNRLRGLSLRAHRHGGDQQIDNE
jgi:ribose transport system ATP-binding protein